jgi:hypothetical protein
LEQPPLTVIPVMSVGLAAEEQQEELPQQFMSASSSASDDSDSMPIPDADDSGGVQGIAGHGFQIDDDELPEDRALGDWGTPPDLDK